MMALDRQNTLALSRRRAITSISAAISFPVLGLPDRLYAGSVPHSYTLDVAITDDFLSASAALTGIDAVNLSPSVKQDSIALEAIYHSLCDTANSAATSAFVDAYVALRDKGLEDQDISQQLLTTKSAESPRIRVDEVGCMARLTMQMWLFGVWYGHTEVSRVPQSKEWITGEWAVDMVTSGRAYKNGWIWRIAQSHPMGFSHFNFGSWADLPPGLEDYGIN